MHDNLSIDQSHPEQAIPYPLSSYFELVEWSGRITRKGNCGRITDDVPPILERLGIDPLEWLETMRWNNRFHRALASLKTYEKTLERLGSWHGCEQGTFYLFPSVRHGYRQSQPHVRSVHGTQGCLAGWVFQCSPRSCCLLPYRPGRRPTVHHGYRQSQSHVRSVHGTQGCLAGWVFQCSPRSCCLLLYRPARPPT
ncbi:hypothetical protein J7438_23140, partial [Thalassotalea sp. G20_0]|nr:hypothetical protein [Thalassotalea sp. G20_0]